MMKRAMSMILAVLLAVSVLPSALAWELEGSPTAAICYPSSVTRSDDGSEIRKVYELSPTEDPAGIPRSDFEQEGYHYTLTDLLRQEVPEYQEQTHKETVSVESKSKDMESILALLPQQREFVTEDGLAGVLTLQLDTVQVEASGYGSSTKEVSATRTYPSLASQDTQYIPKSIQDSGRTLTLQNISWQGDGSGYGERYTAVATYTGTATSNYVKGYTVTADYVGTVSRIALNKVRYVAIFEGEALEPEIILPEPEPTRAPEAAPAQFHWAYVLVPVALIALAGGGIGLALFLKHKHENESEEETV